ncbi:hypothetical protein [Streptomyces sp. NPDC050355]|uniref:hypothetical protein n=1 Tax=Streptomyces TaxID=1883 RepID=UPI0037AA071F
MTLATLGAATTAQAQTPHAGTKAPVLYAQDCPGDGKMGTGVVCTSLSSGAVWHVKGHSPDLRITTTYDKTSGGRITAKLGYNYKGRTSWGGQFTQVSGTTKSKSWTVWDEAQWCAPTIGVMWVKGQGTFQTPSAGC